VKFLQPNTQSKPQKEGSESEQFWDLLGGKSEYPSQKLAREAESDPHLFSCIFLKGREDNLSVFRFVLLPFTFVRISCKL
jgi:gelsolin